MSDPPCATFAFRKQDTSGMIDGTITGGGDDGASQVARVDRTVGGLGRLEGDSR